jgi:diketogulonate reductase-like aldo/keto reductase
LPWTRHTVTRVSFASDLNIGGRRGILVVGYSPLATGSILDNSDIGHIAAGYGKSVAQHSIRYVVKEGVFTRPAIRSSSLPAHRHRATGTAKPARLNHREHATFAHQRAESTALHEDPG